MTNKEPSFEQAINFASLWCSAWERGELSDEVLADRVSELLASANGMRGFFVVSLSSDNPLMDRLPEPLLFKLRQAKEAIVDLTVRNLAMSTAMTVQHRRHKNKIQESSSARISYRCIELLRLLDPISVKKRIEILIDATNGKGEDVKFLDRWGYDDEQKLAISENINSIAENKKKEGF